MESIPVSANNVIRGTENSDSVYYTLSGLLPRTSYSLRLRTVCESENSAWADATVAFTTLNNEQRITAFNLNGQYSSTIDEENATVTVLMPYGTDRSMLGGSFTMSYGSTADTAGINFPTTIASGTDFSEPLTLNVKAQDLTLGPRMWTINVVNEACARPLGLMAKNVDKYNFDLKVTPNAASENNNYQIVNSLVAMDAEALATADKIDYVYNDDSCHFGQLLRDTTYYIYVRGNCGDDGYSEWVNTTVKTKAMGYTNCDEEGPVVQVGTGTSSAYLLFTSYGNTYSQHIYTAEELHAQGVEAGSITSIAFNYTGTSSSYDKTQSVYIGTTTNAAFAGSAASNFVPADEMTLVYGPTLNSYQSGWRTYEFAEPFEWDGTSNIVVGMLSNSTATASTGWSAQGTSVGAYRTIYRYRDNTPIDITSLSSVNNGNYALARPNIKFSLCGFEEVCPAPVIDNVALTGTGTNTANVTWHLTGGEFPNGCNVVVLAHGSTDFNNPVQSYTVEAETFSRAISGLEPYTEYDVYVSVNCDANGYNDGTSEWSEPVTFMTNSDCSPVEDLTYVVNSKTQVTISWINGSIEDNYIVQPNNFMYGFGTAQQNVNSVAVEAAGIQGNADGTASETLTVAPGNTYYFYVANQCGNDGTSPYRELVVEMPVPCAVPTNVEATDVDRYEATISWAGDAYEFDATFELYYGLEPVENLAELAPLPGMDEIAGTTVTLGNLLRDTTYYVYVRTNCADYPASEWSPVYTFHTRPDIDCGVAPTQVGEGTATTSNFPISTWYHNSYAQQLYLEDEIGKVGQISSLQFNYFGSTAATRNITVYMGTTDATSFGSTWITPDDMTEVMSAQDVTFSIMLFSLFYDFN